MSRTKTLAAAILTAAIVLSIAACGATPGETTTTAITAPEITEPAPTEPQAITEYDGAVIVATDTSPEDWKSRAEFICAGGEIPAELITSIMQGGKVFQFAPGEYLIEGSGGTIRAGSDTTIVGGFAIKQPVERDEMLYPDPSYMAVFVTRTQLLSTEECTEAQYGLFSTRSGAKNVTIRDIALSGHTVLKLDNAFNASIRNVLIHNYRGTYPVGEWCNMGYGKATGSLWIFGSCREIEISECQIQCSSHHGLAIHSASKQFLAKNIHISKTRALYCGNGQLMGDTEAQIRESALRMTETGGHGYVDWSVAFDLCENQSIENVTVEDCFALDGWKAGFYTEPQDTGGPVKNLKLIRCRSEYAGQRALIPNSDPRTTIPRETEGANFFVQGGYFEDCVSIGAEKTGWYLNPNRTDANPTGSGLIQMVNCGDMGSPISLLTEMQDSTGLRCEGFFSINALNQAIWLFGKGDFILNDTVVLCENQTKPPIKLGYMIRMRLTESRDWMNQQQVKTGGVFDQMRIDISGSSISGTVYNLPEIVGAVEIASGSTFNGVSDPAADGSGISLARDNATELNICDFIN